MIESCLRLHGLLCPQQMIPFHNTLETFFRRNFQEEIQRLAVEFHHDANSISSRPTQNTVLQSYQSSLQDHGGYERSVPDSLSSNRPNFAMTPLDVGRPAVETTSLSPVSVRENVLTSADGVTSPGQQQSLLQRHMAHLTRHGFNGVASGPRERAASDSFSEIFPHESFTNGHNIPLNMTSAASITTSTMGSIGGSIRGRISKFGSLNFGRRDG